MKVIMKALESPVIIGILILLTGYIIRKIIVTVFKALSYFNDSEDDKIIP